MPCVPVVVHVVLRCLNQLFQLPQLLLPHVGGSSFECVDAVGHGSHDLVGMADGGVGDALVLELERVRQLFASGGLYVAGMCAIMFW